MDRRGVRSGTFFRTIDPFRIFTKYLVEGQVASDGIAFSAVATVGTTAVTVFNQLIDESRDIALTRLELMLQHRMDNLNAAAVGTAIYVWRGRIENEGTLGPWIGLCPTMIIGVPTSGVAGDPAIPTLSGYFPVGSLREAPLRLQLVMSAGAAAQFAADVKNTSYVTLQGNVIPGV